MSMADGVQFVSPASRSFGGSLYLHGIWRFLQEGALKLVPHVFLEQLP